MLVEFENQLQVINHEIFGEIRVIKIDNKEYFVANDVAKTLGYKNTSKVIKDHCKGVTKRYIPTNGGSQEMNLIPIGDVCRLCANSKLPSAQEFESWVFDEVLPCLLKYGFYMVGMENMTPEEIKEEADKRTEWYILRKFGIGVRKNVTDAIKKYVKPENNFIYSNYTNIIYLLIFGANASKCRKLWNLPTKANIRDNIPADKLDLVSKAENAMIIFLQAGITEYEQLKNMMTMWYGNNVVTLEA